MGFFDMALSLLQKGAEASARKRADIMNQGQNARYRNGYGNLSDYDLKRIYNSKSSSWQEKFI